MSNTEQIDLIIETIVSEINEGILQNTTSFAKRMWGDLKKVPSKYTTELKTSPFGKLKGGQFLGDKKFADTPGEALASHLSNLEGETTRSVRDYTSNIEAPALARQQAKSLLRKGVLGNQEKLNRVREMNRIGKEARDKQDKNDLVGAAVYNPDAAKLLNSYQ